VLLDTERNRREDWEAELDAVLADESLLEADDVPIDTKPIFERCHGDPVPAMSPACPTRLSTI
jgi:hypothetical protein